MFYEKAVFKNLGILIGKHLFWCLFLINLQAYKPYNFIFNLTEDEGGGEGGGGGVEQALPPPTSFSPVTSTNVGIFPQNVLTFGCNQL